jgi:hypothetical protein
MPPYMNPFGPAKCSGPVGASSPSLSGSCRIRNVKACELSGTRLLVLEPQEEVVRVPEPGGVDPQASRTDSRGPLPCRTQMWWISSAIRMLPRMIRLYAYIKTIESNLVGSNCHCLCRCCVQRVGVLLFVTVKLFF